MKSKVKLPFLLLLASLWITALGAQSFRSGLRLGINTSQINGDAMAGFHKAGPVGGMYVAYPFSKKWSGQFELLYSQKGSKRQFSIDNGGGPGNWNLLRLHYIELPVMAEYTVNKKIRLHAGLGAAYLFGAHLEDLNGLDTQPDSIYLKKYELSSFIGGQYYFNEKVSAFIRYTGSLHSIGKSDGPLVTNNRLRGLISSVASFGIYYHFVPRR